MFKNWLKRKRRKHFPVTFSRELDDGQIVLNTDMDIDADAVMDLLVDLHTYDIDIDAAAKEVYQMVWSDKEKKGTIVISECEGTWKVFLTHDLSFEIEV